MTGAAAPPLFQVVPLTGTVNTSAGAVPVPCHVYDGSALLFPVHADAAAVAHALRIQNVVPGPDLMVRANHAPRAAADVINPTGPVPVHNRRAHPHQTRQDHPARFQGRGQSLQAAVFSQAALNIPAPSALSVHSPMPAEEPAG